MGANIIEDLTPQESDQFGFVELPDTFTTGSSIMPQKKNPDVLELIRGKSGRVFGHLTAMLTVMKGLPLAYNRDLQEDKEALFDTVDTVTSSLQVLTRMMPKVRFNKDIMKKASEKGYLTATDLAEYLVRKGMPFRDAHRVTGELVRHCIDNNKAMGDLSLKEFRRFSELIGRDIFHHISVKTSIEEKKSFGGTSKRMVLARIKKIRKKD